MKPQKQWWDNSVKKPRTHSIEFLQKQAEKAADIETGMDKFDLVNRPYFLAVPDVVYAIRRYAIVEQIEKGLPRLAKRMVKVLATVEPTKGLHPYRTPKKEEEKEEAEEDIVQE